MKSIRTELVKACVSVYNQGSKSANSNGFCAYRGSDDCKCVIGHMIDDAVYSPSLESRSVDAYPVKDALIASGFDAQELKLLIGLMIRIQSAHDGVSDTPSEFGSSFLKLLKKSDEIIYNEVYSTLRTQGVQL